MLHLNKKKEKYRWDIKNEIPSDNSYRKWLWKNPPRIVEFQSDTKSLHLYSAVLVSIYNPIDVPVKFIDYTYN